MVPRHRQVGHRPDRNRITLRAFNDDRPFDDRLEIQDRHLRLIDDRGREHGTELPRVGDRERPTVDLVGLESLRTSALGQLGDRRREPLEAEPLGSRDHRNDQPLVERHRDPEVDVVVMDELVAIDRRVEDRVMGESLDRRAGDEGEIGEPHAAPRHRLLELGAARRDARHVDLDDRRAVRRRAAAVAHVLGDQPAHRGHRLPALTVDGWLAGRGLGLTGVRAVGGLGVQNRRRLRLPVAGARLDVGEHVSLPHPAADPRPLHLIEVDSVLVGDPPHHR